MADNDSPLKQLMKSIMPYKDEAMDGGEDPSRSPVGGKWSEPGVPHKGWHVVDYYKLDEQDQLWEMCERQTVMFVHVMRDEQYPDDLRVDCVCAEHMEDDTIGARQHEV